MTLNPSCFAQVFQFPFFGLTFSQDVNNDIQKALPFWRVVEKTVQFTAAVHHVLYRSYFASMTNCKIQCMQAASLIVSVGCTFGDFGLNTFFCLNSWMMSCHKPDLSSCQEEISGTSSEISKSPQNPSSPCSNSAELIRTYSICGDLRGTF